MSENDHPQGTCGLFCPYCKAGVSRNLEAVRKYEQSFNNENELKETILNDERVPCQDCDGRGKIFGFVEGVPASICKKYTPCERCWPRNADGTKKFWNDGTAGTLLSSTILIKRSN